MSRWPFTVAHAVKRQQYPFGVYVYRTNQRRTLNAALKRARLIERAGYLVWIEQTGSLATR